MNYVWKFRKDPRVFFRGCLRWLYRGKGDQAHSNDVPLSSWCPPRRSSDAGVGIKMLRGFPYLKMKKVYWFSVLVSWFQTCFMFSKDIRYILPNFYFMFFDRYEMHIQALGDFISTTLHHFPILICVTYNKE